MIALGQHLRRHEEQPAVGLAFRRDCPICREERVAGRLPDDRIISVNARVTVAIGSLLAGGALPPGVALADRGERSREAIAVEAPQAPAPPRTATAPSDTLDAGAAPAVDERDQPFGEEKHGRARGEGGKQADVETTQPPSHERPAADRGARGEPKPTGRSSGTDDPVASDDPDVSADPVSMTPRAQPPRPAAPLAQQPTAEAEPERGAAAPASTPSTSQESSRADAASASDAVQDSSRASTENATRAQAREARAASTTSRSGTPPGAAQEATAADKVARTPSTYTVNEGDCLWYVAARQLGDGASDAEIAKEVTRLWKLNAKRIGTGDPDLIYPGQTLAL